MWSSTRRNRAVLALGLGLAAYAAAEPALAQMSTASQSEFQVGSGQSASAMKTIIAQLVGVVTAFVVVWILIGAFRGWARARIAFSEFLWVGMRISLFALFIGFFIRP